MNYDDMFLYEELDDERGCLFLIPNGFGKPDDEHLKTCEAYQEAITEQDASPKIVLLMCPDCYAEGRNCGNKKATYRRKKA